jgi:hypothetical protein
VGLSAGAFRTTLVFSDDTRRPLRQTALSVSLEYRLSHRWTLSGSGGWMPRGETALEDGTSVRLNRGAVGSLGVSWLALEPEGAKPFVMLSGALAISRIHSAPSTWTSGDLRLGVSAGYTFFERLSPYLTARAFGGPVSWNGLTATDRYHFQLGAGLALGLPAGFDLVMEGVPLGEKSLTVGVGLSF